MKHTMKALMICTALALVPFAAQAETVKSVYIEQGQHKSLSEAQIVGIQQSLASRGFYHGAVNGMWTPETLEAVRSYQVSRSLQPSGMLMTTDLEALGLYVGPREVTKVTTEKVDIRKHGNGPNARGWQAFQE